MQSAVVQKPANEKDSDSQSSSIKEQIKDSELDLETEIGLPIFLKSASTSRPSIYSEDGEFEGEADRVADAVAQDSESTALKPTPEAILKRSPSKSDTREPIIKSNNSGSALHPETRRRIESRTGEDLSHVRVHEDSGANHANKKLNSRAFAQGSNIWLGAGESQTDIKLMAHEATHVVQQGRSDSTPKIQRQQTAPEVAEELDIEAISEDLTESQEQINEPQSVPEDATLNPGQSDQNEDESSEMENAESEVGTSDVDAQSEEGETEADELVAEEVEAVEEAGEGGDNSDGEGDEERENTGSPGDAVQEMPSVGSDDLLSGLQTGEVALIDTELAEHQRWGAASERVGTAQSLERAEFVAEAAGGGLLGGLASGAAMGLGMGLVGRAAARFIPIPGVGGILSGAMSVYGLASRDWSATGATISNFGEGASTYETLANSVAAIAEIIDVVSNVLGVVEGIVGVLQIAVYAITGGAGIATVLTLGAAGPILAAALTAAETLTTIALALGVVTTALDLINAGILQPAVLLFRALHAFTSEADPREVEAQGADIGTAAGAIGGAVGGAIGARGAAVGGRPRTNAGDAPNTRPHADTPVPAAGGNGPSVRVEIPRIDADGPSVRVEAPRVDTDVGTPTTATGASRPAIRPPANPDAPVPDIPAAPRVPEIAPTPDFGPEPDYRPAVDPLAPTIPVVDPHAPTLPAARPTGTTRQPPATDSSVPASSGDTSAVTPPRPAIRPPANPDAPVPDIPAAPRVPEIAPTPDFGPEPDYRPAVDPLAPTIPVVDPHAPTLPAARPTGTTRRPPATDSSVPASSGEVPDGTSTRPVSAEPSDVTPADSSELTGMRIETIGDGDLPNITDADIDAFVGGIETNARSDTYFELPGRNPTTGGGLQPVRPRGETPALAPDGSPQAGLPTDSVPGVSQTTTNAANPNAISFHDNHHFTDIGTVRMADAADVPVGASRGPGSSVIPADVGTTAAPVPQTRIGDGADSPNVEVRYHAENPGAPAGTYSAQNPTVQINTPSRKYPWAPTGERVRGMAGRYLLPDGTWVTMGAASDAQKAAAHLPVGGRSGVPDTGGSGSTPLSGGGSPSPTSGSPPSRSSVPPVASTSKPPTSTPDSSSTPLSHHADTTGTEAAAPHVDASAAPAMHDSVSQAFSPLVEPDARTTSAPVSIAPDTSPTIDTQGPNSEPTSTAPTSAHDDTASIPASMPEANTSQTLEEQSPTIEPAERIERSNDEAVTEAPEVATPPAQSEQSLTTEPLPETIGNTHNTAQGNTPSSPISTRQTLKIAGRAGRQGRINEANRNQEQGQEDQQESPTAPQQPGLATQLGQLFVPQAFAPEGDAPTQQQREDAHRGRFAEDAQAGNTNVERINPEYPPPPGTPQQLEAIQQEIENILAARAQAEQAEAEMESQEQVLEADQTPIQQAIEGADGGITAVQAHQEAVTRREQMNQEQQQRQQETGGLVSGYPSRAAGLATLTIPLDIFAGFTSLGSHLPGDAGAKMREMNQDAVEIRNAFTQMGVAMVSQEESQPDRQTELSGQQSRIEATDAEATATNQSIEQSRQDGQVLQQENEAQLASAQLAQSEASGQGRILDEAAATKQTQADSLTEQLQAWAVSHKAARHEAVEATAAQLEADGYVVLEKNEG